MDPETPDLEPLRATVRKILDGEFEGDEEAPMTILRVDVYDPEWMLAQLADRSYLLSRRIEVLYHCNNVFSRGLEILRREDPTLDRSRPPRARRAPAAPARLRPRSVAEEHLYMSLRPCVCGMDSVEGLAHGVRQEGGELVSYFSGPCPRCSRPREFVFMVPEQQLPRGQLGGDAPSTLIDPGEFLNLSDIAARRVPMDPTELTADQRGRARRDLLRAIALLEEVLKFIPIGASEVPGNAFRGKIGALSEQHEPGRFSRVRLEARLGAFRELLDMYPEG